MYCVKSYQKQGWHAQKKREKEKRKKWCGQDWLQNHKTPPTLTVRRLLLQLCDVLIKLVNVHQAVKQHLNELFPSPWNTYCTNTVARSQGKETSEKLRRVWKAIKCCWRRARNTLSVCICLSVCYCFSVTPSLSRWFFVFFCLSACEVKVASMVTAHSVYATMSHFITSCWWLWFACVPVLVCLCVCVATSHPNPPAPHTHTFCEIPP